MPIGPVHAKQRGKNFFLLLLLMAVVVGLFYLSIVKIQGAPA